MPVNNLGWVVIGSVIGQIAKIKNCKVIGIAGGVDKCNYLIDTLGFDGAISQYNNADEVKGSSNYLSLLVCRATMKGMVVFDYAKDYRKAAQQMGQ